MGFNPINRWPSKSHHLRNVEISLEVSTGKTYREVAKLYDLSRTRVEQVYRILAAKLCEREFKIEYLIAVYDKQWTRHADMPHMIRKYHDDYTAWITKNNNGENNEKMDC